MESPKAEVHEDAANLPEIASVTTRSRHSSIAPQATIPQSSTDPYGRPMNCFPICNPVSSAYGGVESYARSLLFTGNGFPIFDVLGDRNRSARYLQRGVGIGDVGILDPAGDFVFAFNIFADPDDPLHADDIPPEFEQLPQPEASEVKITKNHFPGTVITSKGVKVNRSQDSPLKFTLSTEAREAGVLVLPEGALREDWNADTALLSYLERHAVDWYQHICHNIKASVTTVPNGSIYLTTGLDKAQAMSAVSIPRVPERSGKPLELDYDGTDIADPWTMTGATSAEISNRQTDEAPFAVFLRGIRISLGDKLWRSNLDEILSDEMPYYNLLSTPITGFVSRLVRRKELIFGVPSSSLPGRQQVLFHVSDVLAQVLLDENPEADYAFVEDSTWNTHVLDISDGTRTEVVNLLIRVLSSSEAKADGKNVTLQPKTLPVEPTNFFSRIMGGMKTRRHQQQTKARIQKVFNRR